jgi:hypothetical protein
MDHVIVANLRIPDHSNFSGLRRVAELIDNDHRYGSVDAQCEASAPSRVGASVGSPTIRRPDEQYQKTEAELSHQGLPIPMFCYRSIDVNHANVSVSFFFCENENALATPRSARRCGTGDEPKSHNRRHKLQPVRPETSRLRFSQLTSPSQTTAAAIIRGVEPPHTPSLRSSRPRQQFAPCPRIEVAGPVISTCDFGTARENFQPANRLGDSTMVSVHSKPNGPNQTANSQIRSSVGGWQPNSAYS